MLAEEPSYEEERLRAIKETTLCSPKDCSGEEREVGEKGSRMKMIKANTMGSPKYHMNERYSGKSMRHSTAVMTRH